MGALHFLKRLTGNKLMENYDVWQYNLKGYTKHSAGNLACGDEG